jgi:carboxylesterase type B
VYNNITGLKIYSYGQSLAAGAAALGSAEDCLSLGVWTPAHASPDSGLPVVLFLTGGGDTAGGVFEAGQLPSNWVHRSQKHIVVTTDYRLGILGFPNTPLLSDTNFGFQDARAAVEWVHENIAAFGGDPEKITLWGQSAGSSTYSAVLVLYNTRHTLQITRNCLTANSTHSIYRHISVCLPR